MNNKFSIWELAKGMFVISSIGFVFLWITFSLFIDKGDEPPKLVDNIITVPTTTPDGIGGQEDPQIADLITTTLLSKDIYNFNTYKSESIDVAFKGEFETAELRVEANVNDDFRHFLFIGFGTTNGFYGVDRISAGEWQYDPDTAFTKEDSIKNIDLMSQVKLSNSAKEVQSGFSPSKLRRLWDYIWPPVSDLNGSIVNTVVSLYNPEEGKFDSEISKLQILYRCKDSKKCEVNICSDKKELGSACLDRLFGKGSGDNYGKKFKILVKP